MKEVILIIKLKVKNLVKLMANCHARGYIDNQVKGQDFGQVDGHVKHKLNGWANSTDVQARVYLPTSAPAHLKVAFLYIPPK